MGIVDRENREHSYKMFTNLEIDKTNHEYIIFNPTFSSIVILNESAGVIFEYVCNSSNKVISYIEIASKIAAEEVNVGGINRICDDIDNCLLELINGGVIYEE